ncbi:S49 family peptidase [Skermanella stibiiresistens]|nr:S49 family peptidase [Skermanella stibiiresistens]
MTALGRKPAPIVSVLRLSGVIGAGGALRQGITLSALAPAIQKAFAVPGQQAVALQINSPGGSPVQSALVAGRIRQLADEKKVPVFAFAEDVAASGGYWLACAADEIYADPSSIIGSIGVVSAGFGFQDLIARHGIERRVHTSGTNKAMLDPFKPERDEDVVRLKAIQTEIHDAFKTMVRSRRGDRLKGGDEDLFTGEFWTGAKALDLGLIDGLGDLRSVMRGRFGEKVDLRLVHADRRWWRGRIKTEGGAFSSMVPAMLPTNLADDFAGAMINAIEERAIWSRFGL